MKEVTDALIVGIRDYFEKNNCSKAVIGISGGIDSAVAAYLTVAALGKENVAGVLMPDEVTSDKSMNDAMNVVESLGIRHVVCPIDEHMELVKDITAEKNPENSLAFANTKARIRMSLLYYLAHVEGALVIGTSDKSEIALGYTTKFGDNASDISVNGDLWKTEIRQLAKHLGVSSSIIRKKSGPELQEGVDAETELGASYTVIDDILRLYVENRLSVAEIVKRGFERKLVNSLVKRVAANEHKRRSPPILKVSYSSFNGSEWRMPVSKK